jgi:pimeloyl-ACP methyl ester carboxylesterase
MDRRHAASALASSFLLAWLVTSCSNGESSSQSPARTSATETASSETTVASERTDYERVRFSARDGVELVGRLWGDGNVAVVLAHGFSQGSAQDGWLPFAPVLADRGYSVLTFDFRGFCDSEDCSERRMELGKNWLDVLAAVRFMDQRGAKRIFLIGASMGGLAVLRAARMPGTDVAGVVSLSTPRFPGRYYTVDTQANDVTPARLRQIDEPKLFVAGTDDVQLPGSAPLRPGIERVVFAEDARRMFAAAEEPKQLVLVDSSFHSSDLVTIAPDDVVRKTRAQIFRFLEANS